MKDIHSLRSTLLEDIPTNFSAGVGEQHADKRLMEDDDDSLEEISTNDPILVAMRAKQMGANRDKSIKGGTTKKSLSKPAILTAIRNLKRERSQIERDMEQEAEPAGGSIADSYGQKLNNIDAKISKLMVKLKSLSESNINETFTQEDYAKAAEILDKIKSTSSNLYSALIQMIIDTQPHSSQDIDKAVSKFGLNENYSKFKKETSQRARKKQYYEGLKMAESKMKEAKSIVEYVSRLKEEMSGELPLEENSFMRKLKERMTRTIAEMYSKYKSL